MRRSLAFADNEIIGDIVQALIGLFGSRCMRPKPIRLALTYLAPCNIFCLLV